MKMRLAFLMTCLFVFEVIAESQVVEFSFIAKSVNRPVCIAVYLPDGYNSESAKRYPVIYFLHGAHSGYEPYVPLLTAALDKAIEDLKVIQPVIVVFPKSLYPTPYGSAVTSPPNENHTNPLPSSSSSMSRYGGTFWSNSQLNGNWRDYVVKDMVSCIDRKFKTVPHATARTIMGFSDGGEGAMVIGLMHSDVFATTVAFAGAFIWENVIDILSASVLDEYRRDNPPPYYFTPEKPWSRELFRVAAAYSPNLKNLPYLLDYPYDENGNVDQEVLAQWRQYNGDVLMINLVNKLAPTVVFPPTEQDPLPKDFHPLGFPNIFFSCGKSDGVNISGSRFLDQRFKEWGIPYHYVEFNGGHDMPENVLLGEAFPYINQNMMAPVVAPSGIKANKSPLGFELLPAYPNPFNGTTRITFKLQSPQKISIVIYDIKGRCINTLINETVDSGLHSILWDGCDDRGQEVSSGVYHYRILLQDHILVENLVFIK